MFRAYLNIICFAVGLLLAPCIVNADDIYYYAGECPADYEGALSSSFNYTDNLDSNPLPVDQTGQTLGSHGWIYWVKSYFYGPIEYPFGPSGDAYCRIRYTVSYYCNMTPYVPTGTPDADGDYPDCGGDSGVDCQQKCPEGWVLFNGNTCLSASPNPIDPSDWPASMGDYQPLIYGDHPVAPVDVAPDYDPPDSDFDMPTVSTTPLGPSSPSDSSGDDGDSDDDNDSSTPTRFVPIVTVTNQPTGDYVTRDADGNITGAKISSPNTTVDNGDGTSTVTGTTTVFNADTGQNETTTNTSRVDNDTGEIIDTNTTTTGTTGTSGGTKLVGVGLGDDGGLTGDQYARGVDQIVEAINGDEVAAPEYTSDLDAVDESNFDDIYSGVNPSSYISQLESSLVLNLSNPACTFDAQIDFLGSQDISMSICEYEGLFNKIGYVLLFLSTAWSFFVITGGRR